MSLLPFNIKMSALKDAHARRFTEPGSPGHIYRHEYERLERALRLPADVLARGDVDPRLSHDGAHWFLLPSFFVTLDALHRAGRDFAVVVRTFGTDGAAVGAALTAWAEGRHPTVRGVPSLAVRPRRDLWRGRYDAAGCFALRRAPPPDGAVGGGDDVDDPVGGDAEVLAEEAALAMLEARDAPRAAPRAAVCADHYDWWKARGYAPSAGKPLWITFADGDAHHIFFDDNIHNDASDSIVAVRARRDATERFSPLSGEDTRRLQGVFLVRTPTPEPILRPRWFLEQIETCEAARTAQFRDRAVELT